MDVVDRTIQTRHGAMRVSDTGGDGFPVLFVHGSGSSREVFERQFDSSLLSRYRLVAMDLPGHGTSSDASDPQHTYSVTGLADCVGEVLDQMRIRRAAVLGWSLGGHVAIEMLSRGRHVAGLALTGTPPVTPGLLGMLRGFHPSFDILLASKEAYSARDAERFLALCFDNSAAPGFLFSILRSDGRARSIFSRSMMRGDGANQHDTVVDAAVPIAFINGSDDPFVRLSYVAGLHLNLPFEGGAHVIEGAGHAPFWEEAAEFNRLFARFVDTVVTNERLATQRRKVVGTV
jgi:pimeloyl-ACP methyl ester carboxylesterase